MKLRILLGIGAMSLALVGCSNTKQATNLSETTVSKKEINSTQEVALSVAQLPDILDSNLNNGPEGNFVINHMYEGLMRRVGDELLNAIAESYTVSEDGLVYTFILKDALWSNGESVTATDFESAWRRGVNPLNKGAHLMEFQNSKIKNAGAIVRGEMSPNALGVLALEPDVLSFMALEAFLPCRQDIIESTGKWSVDETVVLCNGPFKLASYDKETGFTLVKNENYWNANNVFLTKLEAKVVQDLEVATNQYLKDEVDILIGKHADTMLDNISEQKLVEENMNTILVHDWIEGWRIDKEGMLWLGNAYVTK